VCVCVCVCVCVYGCARVRLALGVTGNSSLTSKNVDYANLFGKSRFFSDRTGLAEAKGVRTCYNYHNLMLYFYLLTFNTKQQE
jgi:hypothetical protein